MITIEQIKQLREETGLSISECKKALEKANGNVQIAKEELRKLGIEVAQKRKLKEAGEGLVESYIHTTGKLGAIIDVRCETDFVARSPEFKALCHELAMQVASMDPGSVQELLEQPYIKDPSRQVKDIVTDAIAKLQENIVIKRFSRFEI